jgi:tetratricopeptide (TPR) repeat protein
LVGHLCGGYHGLQDRGHSHLEGHRKRRSRRLAGSYAALGREADAIKLYEDTLALLNVQSRPEVPARLALTKNNRAWLLVTASDVQLRDPAKAVQLATQAVQAAPKEADYRGTLGAARYRLGDWKGAIADLEQGMSLRKPEDPRNASEGFFLAMAHWQVGEQDKARDWFARSVAWTEKGLQDNAEMKRFRAEAAELLGVADKP